MAAEFDRRQPGRVPQFYKPSVGRTWCRVYASRDAASQYEQGWRNPEAYTPAACGTPAQQGALDRLQEAAS
jgi:hypothetical protein